VVHGLTAGAALEHVERGEAAARSARGG
jgi:hypothetical protein